MTNQELELKIKEALKGISSGEIGEFEIVGYSNNPSKNYKYKLSVDVKCKGYGDKGIDGNGKSLDEAIDELAYAIEGEWDYDDKKWHAFF